MFWTELYTSFLMNLYGTLNGLLLILQVIFYIFAIIALRKYIKKN